jgi:hypothetical protein
MDVQLAAQAVGELAHLAPHGVAIALCGLGGIKVVRKFMYIGKVGCKDCRQEYARRMRECHKHERR